MKGRRGWTGEVGIGGEEGKRGSETRCPWTKELLESRCLLGATDHVDYICLHGNNGGLSSPTCNVASVL